MDFFEQVEEQNKDVFNQKLEAAGERLELIIAEHLALHIVLSPFSDVHSETFKKPQSAGYSKALPFFTALLNNGINNLRSVKMHLSIGMDLQARIMLRNYIETMEVAMAILLDEQFYHLYILEPENKKEEKAKWMNTKPSEVCKKIEASVQKDDGLKRMWELGKEIRNKLYGNSSKAVHVTSIAIL